MHSTANYDCVQNIPAHIQDEVDSHAASRTLGDPEIVIREEQRQTPEIRLVIDPAQTQSAEDLHVTSENLESKQVVDAVKEFKSAKDSEEAVNGCVSENEKLQPDVAVVENIYIPENENEQDVESICKKEDQEAESPKEEARRSTLELQKPTDKDDANMNICSQVENSEELFAKAQVSIASPNNEKEQNTPSISEEQDDDEYQIDQEIEMLRQELDRIRNENIQRKKEAELQSLQEQEALLLKEREQQKQILEAQKQAEEKQLQDAKEKIAQLQKHLEYFQTQGNAIEERIAVLEMEISKIEADGEKALTEIETSQQRLVELQKEYSKLNEVYSDLEGKIRVLCRIRPAPQQGVPCSQPMVVEQLDDHFLQARKLSRALTGGMKEELSKYQFDRVLGPSTTQEQMFEEVITSLTSAMNGKIVCVFAYGQTGSGKTYTMQSVIDQSLDLIFSSSVSDLKISVLEVYAGRVLDLLRAGKNRELVLREGQSAFRLPDLTVSLVETASEAEKVMDEARARRKTSSTLSNGTSSRSHLIVCLEFPSGGRLAYVDLAGSESAEAAVDSSQRQEGAEIRKSLCALKTALAQLKSQKGGKATSIGGIRDSKLTQTMSEFCSCMQHQNKILQEMSCSSRRRSWESGWVSRRPRIKNKNSMIPQRLDS